jgi:sugar transferase (PEP-CTERM system associated)
MLFGRPLIGTAAELESVVEKNRVSRIIVAIEDRRGTLPTAALVRLRVRGIGVEDSHSAIAGLTGRVWLNTVQPSWFVFSDGFHRSPVTTLIKRTLDICFGVVGFTLSLPIMLAVALAVKLDSRGPALYRQVRVGWKGREFEILKFRSMRTDAEEKNGAQWAAVNDPRVTRAGKYLRKFRLDELPQFLNVIRGDMSFVGPRPERPGFVSNLREEIPYYDERHSVRPGLTGWAQVEYHYGASVDDAYRKLEYDLFYLKNMSVLFDWAIMFQTIRIVLAGRQGR